MTAAQVRDHQGYLNARAAAEFLTIEPATLARWRFDGTHARELPHIRIGKGKRGGRCYYRKADVIRFMEAHVVRAEA